MKMQTLEMEANMAGADEQDANPGEDCASAVDSHPQPASAADLDPGRWIRLVDLIRTGDPRGMEELYQVFHRGIRYYLCRQLGLQELDDKMHDTFLIVVQAIQRGDLREPERLMGFVRTVVRRQVAAHIDDMVHTRREQTDLESGIRIADLRQNPEQAAMREEKVRMMSMVLNEVSDRDREILERFYIREEPQKKICREMGLTETQFRLLKHRAKARFGELGRKRLTRKSLSKILLRKSASA